MAEDAYRERALKILPWICVRCTREFPALRLRELTVHHKDGNHHHNPGDGSNRELLCVYRHENEHAWLLDSMAGGREKKEGPSATHRPFGDLAERLKRKDGSQGSYWSCSIRLKLSGDMTGMRDFPATASRSSSPVTSASACAE